MAVGAAGGGAQLAHRGREVVAVVVGAEVRQVAHAGEELGVGVDGVRGAQQGRVGRPVAQAAGDEEQAHRSECAGSVRRAMWLQREITLEPRPRGFHLVTREVERALPELSELEVGLCHLFIRHTSASLTHQRERLARRAARLRDVVRRGRARGLPRLDAHARGSRRHAGPHQGVAAGAVAVAARRARAPGPRDVAGRSTCASTATAAARARWWPPSTVSRAASRSACARSSRTSAGTPRGAGAMRSGSIGVSTTAPSTRSTRAARARGRAETTRSSAMSRKSRPTPSSAIHPGGSVPSATAAR